MLFRSSPVVSWFSCGILGLRMGMIYLLCYALYDKYTIAISLEKNKYLNIRKILNTYQDIELAIRIVEDRIHNYKGTQQGLEVLQLHKHLCQAMLNPENVEIIFKDDPEGLSYYYKIFPENLPIKEQYLSKSFENLLEWAQTHLFFFVFGFLITALIVYVIIKYIKNKKIKETEIDKKNAFGSIIIIMLLVGAVFAVSLVLLSAFGVLETLIALLQSFIPSTLAQIWANEVF